MLVEGALQYLAERAQERKRKETEKALAAGFSSLDEYEERQMEEWRQREIRFEAYVEEHCATTGQPKEQFLAERCQGQHENEKNNFLPVLEPCDCESHISPSFCPQSLIDYKSQDLLETMQILGDQHCLRPEELRIHGDDESKRLSQDALEQHWVRWSEGATTNIPVWAKEDTVLQQIISQDACQSVPLSLAPSLMHGEFASSTSSSASVLKGQSDMSTKLLPTDRAPHPLSDRETPASQACSYALLHGRRMSRLFPSELNKVYKHRSKIITTRSKAPRVAKASWKPSMGLRSRKMSTFYELG